MKKLLILVLLCLPFVAEAQNTGIGTTSPLEFFSVGASSQFRVDASGNVVRIRDVQYSFPSAQATSAGLVLVNNGSGTLSWSKVTTANIAASGTPDATTYLRGDGSWQTPAGGGGATVSKDESMSSYSLTTSYADFGTSVSLSSGYYLLTVFTNLNSANVIHAKLIETGGSTTIIASTMAAAGTNAGRNFSGTFKLTSTTTVKVQILVTAGGPFTIDGYVHIIKLSD